ncbi:MAG: LD-carboxypeptidase [Alphaproteobacteria bacterium]|nr:LD-carboxypeptidase [Alphaproteobacteria bacterium]
MRPPLLRRGARVAVVAPCHVHDVDRLERGMQMARERGLDLHVYPDLLRPWRYLASPDDQRLSQLAEALSSTGDDAVWIARGGSGLTRLLRRLDELPLGNKPVIGFSDVTALFCALRRRGIGPLIHGPVLHSLSVTEPGSVEHLFDLLDGRETAPLDGETWVAGTAHGPLVGGNLSLLAATCGTPWQLDASGAILVIEEIGEHPYRVDRMLQQLSSAGVLDGVVGVAIGRNVGCDPPPGADYALADVFVDVLAPLGVPVVGELPIGHGPHNRAFVWDAPATLSDGTLSWE